MADNTAQGLSALLQSSPEASTFFSSLPAYAQEMIEQRAQNIKTTDELRRYADNLLAGDK